MVLAVNVSFLRPELSVAMLSITKKAPWQEREWHQRYITQSWDEQKEFWCPAFLGDAQISSDPCGPSLAP